MNAFHLMVESNDTHDAQCQPLTLKQLSDLYTSYVLEVNEGNITRAAKVLGVTRRTLQRKLARGSSADK